jgi:hypothetical protein
MKRTEQRMTDENARLKSTSIVVESSHELLKKIHETYYKLKESMHFGILASFFGKNFILGYMT